MDKGPNATTTTIKMWNQSSNSISADDEGITVSIHNAKVDVFKDFTTSSGSQRVISADLPCSTLEDKSTICVVGKLHNGHIMATAVESRKPEH